MGMRGSEVVIEDSVGFHHTGDLTGTRIGVSDGDGEGGMGWMGRRRGRWVAGRMRGWDDG